MKGWRYHIAVSCISRWLCQNEAKMGASTGLILIDMLIRPLLKFGFKFYFVGFGFLFLLYGFIAYKALKSAYLSERHY